MSQGIVTEKFHAYRRGWKDSAKSWLKDPVWANHEKQHIRVSYEAGFEAQRLAHGEAMKTWANVVGYDMMLAAIDR